MVQKRGEAVGAVFYWTTLYSEMTIYRLLFSKVLFLYQLYIYVSQDKYEWAETFITNVVR